MNVVGLNSFSRRAVSPTIMAVLLVLMALALTAINSWAVRDEITVGSGSAGSNQPPPFPGSPGCNACQQLLSTLKSGGQTNLCANPNPACNIPSFPACSPDFTTIQTINSATPITGSLHTTCTTCANNTNYPYIWYGAGLNVTNGTFTGPVSPGFLTVYVTGNLTIAGTATTNHNVRFVVSGAVSFPDNSVFTVNSPATTIISNTVTVGNQPIWINFPGGCDWPGNAGTPGDPNNLLFITTGAFNTGNGGGNKQCISAGIFSGGTLATGGNSHHRFSGASYSTLCPTSPNNTDNGNNGQLTLQPAATNSLQNINACAAACVP